jgi:membrane protease YdiL (CAAX protease family)
MERFSRGERLTIGVAVILAVAAGLFVWSSFTRAFPEARLVFTVDRASSRAVAERFLRDRAPAAAGCLDRRHAAIFRGDDEAKVYLEREVGLASLGELTERREIRLWTWSHRYFSPLDKEEVTVEVAPEGDVVAFAHLLPEEAPGASLAEEAARGAAERFLVEAFRIPPDRLSFVESKREERPGRRDWTFTFERSGWKAAAATWRAQVEVHGDRVGSCRQFLKVPDAWRQSYQRLRAANSVTSQAAFLGIALTLLAGVIVIVREGRRGNVRWRVAGAFAAASLLLTVLTAVNGLPLAMYGLETTDSLGAFYVLAALGALAEGGVQALVVFVVVAAGEALYRARFPAHLRVGALLERTGWQGRRMALGLILGYCLAVVFIAWQVAFYLVGRSFGAWNPAEVPFDNLLNSAFPWVAVLFMGFLPAVSEEFLSRVLSIPLLERLTRSRVAAVVVSAAIWGFAHASYPAQPFWVRGVEVTMAGIAVGAVLYRFGVVPCLVWHYVVDAGYTSMLLVRSGNPYFVATAVAGTAALLVPLAVSLVGAARRGGFVAETGALNAAEPSPPVPPPAPPIAAVDVTAVPARRAAFVALPLLAIGLVLAWVAPDPGLGLAVEHGPSEVRAAARAFLAARGDDPERWRLVVVARPEVLGPLSRRWLLEHGGVAAVARFASEVPEWQVRAFRPEERESWHLSIDDATLAVTRFRHDLREEAPGARLPVDEARALAESALRVAGTDSTRLVFKEARSEERPARTDHELVWKDPTRAVGDADYLVAVTVQGDRVDGNERRFRLPEAWERAREQGTVVRYGLLVVRILVISLLVMHGLLVLVRAVRSGSVPWSSVWWPAGLVAALALASQALALPLAWIRYPNAWPEGAYQSRLLVGLGLGAVARTGLVVLALGILAACFPVAASLSSRRIRGRVAGSSCWAALALGGAMALLRGVEGFVVAWLPGFFPDVPLAVPFELATAVPALAALGGAALGGVAVLCVAGIAAHWWSQPHPVWRRVAAAAGAVVALLVPGAEASPAELAMGLAWSALSLTVIAVLARGLLAANPVAWTLAAGLTAAIAAAAPLLSQDGTVYVLNGFAVLAAAATATWWWLWSRRGGVVQTSPET